MCFLYKTSESDESANLQNNRVQTELNDEVPFERPYFFNKNEIPYVERDEVSHFAEEFDIGIRNKSLERISESLSNFFDRVSYLDENRHICQRKLSDDTMIYIETTPVIADDIIFCLKNIMAIDIHLLVFDLMQYFSDSDAFMDDILVRNGLEYIIPHVSEMENQILLLKTIQILVTFSKNQKSHQKLISSEFTRKFFKICNSLFSPNNFKYINEMIYSSSVLMRQIVGIVTFFIDPTNMPMNTLNLSESEKAFLQHQESFKRMRNQTHQIESIISPKIYKILMNFFLPQPKNKYFEPKYFYHSQLEILQAFKLLHFDFFFIEKVFPIVLKMVPKMIQMNKIDSYQLITIVYENDINNDYKSAFFDPDDKDHYCFPWKCLRESILAEDKNEVFRALAVLRALFQYDKKAITVALRKRVHEGLIILIQNATFDVKEKVLCVINSWLKCTNLDKDRSMFLNKDFVDLLFDNFESYDDSIKQQIYMLIQLIGVLCIENPDLQQYICLRLEEIGFQQ
ncbi:hypothetical protein M9Y10_007600 [Tritrichomonas musculus]|uniref:Uncharacterized protein n=1 Tax=Tritrichomonas musculus TaxID=1915356 RepID=A0ABR2J2S4_9EUKA